MPVDITVPDGWAETLRLMNLRGMRTDAADILAGLSALIWEAQERAEEQQRTTEELIRQGPYCGSCGHRLSVELGHYPSCPKYPLR